MDTIDRINLLLAKKGKTGADLNKVCYFFAQKIARLP